jgi:hypothetical protein
VSFVINSAVPVATTPEIVFLKGSVSLWAYSIPFFTTNVPLGFAAEYFKLFEELPQADTGEWTLEELFQRDISWDRVDNEILEYLKSPTRPQFFNALTVALLPGHATTFGGDFGPDLVIPPITDPGLGKPLSVGGVQIQFYGSDADLIQGAGKMRWSHSHVDAVAVDGQHRLAAIKKFVSQAKRPQWENASVPVIFLIADERVGFQTPKGAEERPRAVSALRSVFIDLNKNAKPVSPTRTILLDDLDIVSVCTRALIGRSLGETVDPERIPLSIVDWTTDRNKIDDGPFVTTVMLLNEAVARLLSVPDIQMDEDDNSVAKVETWLRQILPIQNEAVYEDLVAQVRKCARLQTKLSWLPAHIAALRASFETEWRLHLVRLFREFGPYQRLWTMMAEQDLLGPQFINLYISREVMPSVAGQERAKRLEAAAKAAADGAWTLEKNYNKPLQQIGKIKSDQWAYKIVFQRALLRLFASVLRDPSLYFVGADRNAAADKMMEALNLLDSSGFMSVDKKLGRELFWQGSGLTADATIEFTNAGAERLKSWLEAFLIVRGLAGGAPRFDAVADAQQARPRKHLAKLLDEKSVLFRGMEKLAIARDNDPEDDEVPRKYLKQRYDTLRELART